MSQFDKFTERARNVLTFAQEEALGFNHGYIGTEHLLLGLIRQEDGIAAKVLSNMGVRLDTVRSAVEFIIGRGEGAVVGDISLTPRARKVIELAVDESRRLNHHYIGTEHMLLGLVREGEGIGAGVLDSLGVDLDKVRAQVMRVISSHFLKINEPQLVAVQEVVDSLPIFELLFAVNVAGQMPHVLNTRLGWSQDVWDSILSHSETREVIRSYVKRALQIHQGEAGVCHTYDVLYSMSIGEMNVDDHALSCPYDSMVLEALAKSHATVKPADNEDPPTLPPEGPICPDPL